MPKYKNLVHYIVNYCAKTGKSYMELSEELGKASSYIGQIVNGNGTPSLDTFIEIVNHINISPTIVLSDCLKIDKTKIIEDAYADLKHLKSLNKIEDKDLKLALGFLTMLNDIIEENQDT